MSCSPAIPPLLPPLALQLQFKAEGSANACFRLPDGALLRLRKAGRRVPPPSPDAPRHRLYPTDPLAFAVDVMSPALGEGRVVPGVSVPLGAGFLPALQARFGRGGDLSSAREKGRRDESLDATAVTGVLMRDCSLLRTPTPVPVFCAEIKPKSGVLGWAAGGTPHPACRYCMHQVAKAAAKAGLVVGGDRTPPALQSAAGALSSYCPLQLYSGKRGVVRHAVGCLLGDPQNNFRLFVDGQLLFNCESGGAHATPDARLRLLEGWLAPLADAVAARSTPSIDPSPPAARPGCDLLTRVLEAMLLEDGVLTALHAAQAAAPRGVWPVYSGYLARCGEGVPADCVPGRPPPPHLVATLAEQAASVEAALLREEAGGAPGPADDARAFLLSTSAKDCSLLLTFSVVDDADIDAPSPDQLLRVSLPGRALLTLRTSLVVVDLDPKALSRVPYYALQDCDIRGAYDAFAPALYALAGGRSCGASLG